VQIDLADRKVIGRPPVGVYLAPFNSRKWAGRRRGLGDFAFHPFFSWSDKYLSLLTAERPTLAPPGVMKFFPDCHSLIAKFDYKALLGDFCKILRRAFLTAKRLLPALDSFSFFN
jgi:hypothetical protein